MNKRFTEEHIVRIFEAANTFELPETSAERDIDAIHDMLTKQEPRLSPVHKNVWRTIMENKWTRRATAAIVLIGITLYLTLLPQPKLSAAEILTKVAESMADVAWIKSIQKTYGPGKDEPADITTIMVDYKNKQHFRIHGKGYLHQMDYDKMIWSIYRPEDNTMIVKPLSGEWQDPGTQVEEYIEKLQGEGLEVRQSEEIHDGVKMAVIEFDETLNNISHEPDKYMSKMLFGNKAVKVIRTKLVINRKLLWLGSGETSYIDPDDNLIVTTKYQSEPIDSGPSDIYELGVPDDVKIINKVPSKQVQQLHKKIDQHQSDFIKNYVAIQIETDISDGKERLMEAMVIYSQGKKLRVDVFSRRYKQDYGLFAERSELLGKSLDLMKRYWSVEDLALREVRIYDGLWQYILGKNDGKMIVRVPQRRLDGDMYGDDDLDDFGWRKLWWLNEPVGMYEDDFSTENVLIATEIYSQYDGYRLPKRQRLYVDPDKDYLFKRYVSEKLLDAPWQKEEVDRNDPKIKSKSEEVRIWDVTEYGQTSGGKWYPKTIEIKGYDVILRSGHKSDYNRISRIYLLKENPELSEEIFDPEILK